VGRVELHVHAVIGQQVHGLVGVADSAGGSVQRAGDHEGCGEGGGSC